jgi:hypothetical protein
MVAFASVMGTVGTEEEINLNLFENVIITSTPYIDSSKVFIEVTKQLNSLEESQQVNESDIADVEKKVSQLLAISDEFLQCQFRVRKLKKMLTNRVTENFQISNSSKIFNEAIEESLINEKYVPFINLGKEGRRWVISRLDDEMITSGDMNRIIELIDIERLKLKNSINQLKITESLENVIDLLSEIDIVIEPLDIKELVAEKWINSSNEDINTISKVRQQIDKLIMEISNSGIAKDIVNVELLSHFTSVKVISSDSQ